MRKSFWRAINSLAHPVSIGMVALALLNDHVLRQHWPSWWTGKLSDFAWLAFAPFLLAALLAWLVPSRHEAKVGWLAFGLTGIGFALAKTIPFVHVLAKGTLEVLIGGQVTLIVDPTDLITLPAVLIGWHIWRQAGTQAIELRPRGWVILALAALATVATSQAPVDFGIDCVGATNSTLFAISGGYVRVINAYTSRDGGLSWQQTAFSSDMTSCRWRRGEIWELPSSFDPNIVYRFRTNEGIDRSDDTGLSWTQEVDLSENGSEARRIYYERNLLTPYRIGVQHTGLAVRPTPIDALGDSMTGNIIVAMGHDGVLVRDADGHWHWVDVGPYSLRTFDKAEFLQLLVPNELLLAGILGLLSLTTVIQPVRNDEKCLEVFLLASAWVCWASAAIIFLPATQLEPFSNIISIGFVPTVVVSSLIAAGMTMLDVFNVYEEKPSALPAMFALAIFAGALFLLPYIMWTQANIQHHTTATLFAFALAAATIYAGQQYMKRVFQGKPLMRKWKKVEVE